MGFRFMQPKSRVPTKIKKSEESQAVLDRLNEYLQGAIDEPMRFLESFWRDQITAITYKELRQIAVGEEFPEEIMEVWRQDYAKLISDRFAEMWRTAASAGVRSNQLFQGMDLDTPALVENWIRERSATMVTRMTENQVQAIRYVLDEAFNNRMGSAETARYIRPIIGLTEPQTEANLKYYNHVKEQLTADHPRMKPEAIEQKARQQASVYASKQHRARAESIAQYELASAYHQGNDEAVRICMGNGSLPKMQKEVSTSGDGKVCKMCQSLEGAVVDMDEEFKAKSGRKDVSFSLPPFHPHCGCAVKYVEIRRKTGIIEADRTISGHDRAPKQDQAYAVIDHIGDDGKVDIRTYYDSRGFKHREIHTNDHGNQKQHPFGNHGEHAHIYVWDADGTLNIRAVRNLTDAERKENVNIL